MRSECPAGRAYAKVARLCPNAPPVSTMPIGAAPFTTGVPPGREASTFAVQARRLSVLRLEVGDHGLVDPAAARGVAVNGAARGDAGDPEASVELGDDGGVGIGED